MLRRNARSRPTLLLLAVFPCCAQQPAPAPPAPTFSVEFFTEPLPSPDEVSQLEARLVSTPANLAIRRRLLAHYQRLAPHPSNGNARAARLRHALHVIEHHADDPLAGSRLAFVSRSSDAAGHEQAVAAWLQAASRHGDRAVVQGHAVRFLAVEDKREAISFLLSRMDTGAVKFEAAALLGFVYGEGVLGIDTPDGQRIATVDEATRRAWADESRQSLDHSADPDVLLGAAAVLSANAERPSRDSQKARNFRDYAEALEERGDALRPADLRRVRPLSRQILADVESTWRGVAHPLGLAPTTPDSTLPRSIRVGHAVQAAKLLRKTDPVHPPQAREARIQGMVRFKAEVAPDGTIQSLILVSGHPLLHQAALEAVRTWLYEPTRLNGTLVGVATEIDVPVVPTAP